MKEYNEVSYDDIKKNEAINNYIRTADKNLATIGYNEHSFAHVTKTAVLANQILKELGYTKDEQDMAAISGYMHDIGNLVNRKDHAQSGAIMSFQILSALNMSPEKISIIIAAIGHHDENTASPVNAVAAALILADKSDVRRSRVRQQDRHFSQFDIHDRVCYAVISSSLEVSDNKKNITLKINLDDDFCSVMDYFEIFLTRMILCKKAANYLKLRFRLIINETEIVK